MLTSTLYPYQNEAVDRILDLGYGLVAYEMGLGKTLVGIAVIEELLAQDKITSALIVVPSGLRYQWAESIARFTDVTTTTKQVKNEEIIIPTPAYCTIIDGTPAARAKQYDDIAQQRPEYVIVSYNQVVSDFEKIAPLATGCVVIDEATAIKGFKAQRTKAVKALHPSYPVALTGTPLENRPEEVYSIMEFVRPGYLGSHYSFDTKYIVRNHFGGVRRYRNLDVLHKHLAPVMIRKTRLDPDVAPYMPTVDHTEKYVGMSAKTARLYREIAEEIVEELRANPVIGNFDLSAYYRGESDQDMSTQGRVMARMMALQMLCDHPDLLRMSAQKFVDTSGADGSKYAFDLHEAGKLAGLNGSEKMDAVVEDVRALLDSNPRNKIIVFSFFKSMLTLLQQAWSEYDSVIYNGDMSPHEKAAAKARFQQRPECRIFIASDAGGYGVDLPEANYLINVDLAESAGKMDQRNARHVRAGSAHDNVYVVNYLVEGSIEERTFQRLKFKRAVSRAVVDGKRTGENGVIENAVDTLTAFLTTNTSYTP